MTENRRPGQLKPECNTNCFDFVAKGLFEGRAINQLIKTEGELVEEYSDTPPRVDIFRVLVGFGCALALLVLVFGWVFGVDSLTRLRAQDHAMMPSTALSFLLIALAHGALSRTFEISWDDPSRSLARWSAGAAGAIALVNLVLSEGFGTAGLDQLLPVEVRPGERMAAGTALGILLAACCTALLTLPGAIAADRAKFLALVGLCTATAVLATEILTPSDVYVIPLFEQTSVLTTVLFITVFLSILLAPTPGVIAERV